MNIVTKNINDLHEAPYNPRISIRDNKEFYDKLKRSIDKFGYVEPIIYNKRTGNIVGGNQRLQILRDKGLVDIECIQVDIAEDDEKALNIALNKVVGEWDMPKLNDLLLNLKETDYNISDTGFNDKEINEILDEFREVVEDDFTPPKEAKYKVNTGDIYQLGNHRLMCGDSTKKEDVERLMNNEKADMVFTDPPYGINIVKENRQILFGDGHLGFKNIGSIGADGIVPVGKHHKVIGDETTDTAINSYNLCINMGINNIIMWGGNYYADKLPSSSCWLIWDKREEIPSNNFADCEIAYTTFKHPSRIYRHLWSGLLKKGDRKSESINRLHPTQKPVGLHSNVIKDFTDTNNIILDLFGGSGSTLIACEQTQRQCRMMEIDPYYCSVIIERWETYTGKQHEQINT